jgi:hypothetical protein
VKKPRGLDGRPLRENLTGQLSNAAREGLLAQPTGSPCEPVPPDHVAEVVTKGMAAAREILRLYPWRLEGSRKHDYRKPWPWRAVRHDGLGWRPIGPGWEPDPAVEAPVCHPEDDPAPFSPDLRLDAVLWLYWLAAMRDAKDVNGAMLAAWRAAEARAELWTELEKGWVIRTGVKQRYGAALKGGHRRAKPDELERMVEADERLEAAGVASARERARRLAGSKGSMFPGVSDSRFRNAVREHRKKTTPAKLAGIEAAQAG